MLVVLISLAWIFGSLFALLRLAKPSPPLNNRKQAAGALLAIQVALVICVMFLPRSKTIDQGQVAEAATQEAPAAEGDPSYLVRVNPGDPVADEPKVAPADVAAFRAKTLAGMKTLDAAELVLENAVKLNSVDLARDARNAAQQVNLGMIADRQPFAYTDVYDRSIPCAQAASALSAMATSMMNDGAGTAAVADRLRLLERYRSGRDECGKWVG